GKNNSASQQIVDYSILYKIFDSLSAEIKISSARLRPKCLLIFITIIVSLNTSRDCTQFPVVPVLLKVTPIATQVQSVCYDTKLHLLVGNKVKITNLMPF
ncbi:unnamed protein product, partial [Hymenolepis diminuta]